MARLDNQLKGWRLTTADIIYRLPDYPALLQEFIWQQYDLAPCYPELNRFIKFWSREIEGSIHSIIIAQTPLITDGQVWYQTNVYSLD